ncbi:MAG: virion core protein [Lachnospiraceae bacterium]|jgi:membrane protease subunit (stomatin/prohibitin family)|nr:virion core protein [Lachnospiraceae bacterium]
MGIIKAAVSAIGGALADQWLEVMEPGNMGDQTVFTSGVKIRKGSNVKGTENVVSDGSVIHVYPNQFMMIVDGGKVVDYTAEEGYYTVKNSSTPSLFNGQFKDSLKESFNRIKYGGGTPRVQKVFYVNLQEIKGIKFGTRNPVNYYDSFYNAELFLRAHGTYSIQITDPLRFYAQVIPKNASRVDISSINEQYMNEFLEALQASINRMSAEGERISFVASKGTVLSRHMSEVLDDDWKRSRGFEVMSVGIASISYNEESQKLINMRNQGAMLSDPGVREGYVQGAIARGLEAAGSNSQGSMAGFMGMGVGMNAGGGFMGTASASNMQQMQMNANARGAGAQSPGSYAGGLTGSSWVCGCGAVNTGKFCSECGAPKPAKDTWVCRCGAVNGGKFCSECGSPKPADNTWVCRCGAVNTGKFCSECGALKG